MNLLGISRSIRVNRVNRLSRSIRVNRVNLHPYPKCTP